MAEIGPHIHQPEPGGDRCFVCKEPAFSLMRQEAGLPPLRPYHTQVDRTYGDEVVIECKICGVEWPCPAIKAISKRAKEKRERKAQGT
jgi:hypothetical protein